MANKYYVDNPHTFFFSRMSSNLSPTGVVLVAMLPAIPLNEHHVFIRRKSENISLDSDLIKSENISLDSDQLGYNLKFVYCNIVKSIENFDFIESLID